MQSRGDVGIHSKRRCLTLAVSLLLNTCTITSVAADDGAQEQPYSTENLVSIGARTTAIRTAARAAAGKRGSWLPLRRAPLAPRDAVSQGARQQPPKHAPALISFAREVLAARQQQGQGTDAGAQGVKLHSTAHGGVSHPTHDGEADETKLQHIVAEEDAEKDELEDNRAKMSSEEVAKKQHEIDEKEVEVNQAKKEIDEKEVEVNQAKKDMAETKTDPINHPTKTAVRTDAATEATSKHMLDTLKEGQKEEKKEEAEGHASKAAIALSISIKSTDAQALAHQESDDLGHAIAEAVGTTLSVDPEHVEVTMQEVESPEHAEEETKTADAAEDEAHAEAIADAEADDPEGATEHEGQAAAAAANHSNAEPDELVAAVRIIVADNAKAHSLRDSLNATGEMMKTLVASVQKAVGGSATTPEVTISIIGVQDAHPANPAMDAAAHGNDFPEPRGDRGPQGAKGPRGPAGPTGPPGNGENAEDVLFIANIAHAWTGDAVMAVHVILLWLVFLILHKKLKDGRVKIKTEIEDELSKGAKDASADAKDPAGKEDQQPPAGEPPSTGQTGDPDGGAKTKGGGPVPV